MILLKAILIGLSWAIAVWFICKFMSINGGDDE